MPRLKLGSLRKTVLGRKTYDCWKNIRARCYSTEHPSFENYGGRGIKMQSSWERDPQTFHDYVSSLPTFAPEMTVERIDNDLGYEEGNLTWASRADQAKNRGKMRNNTSGTTGVYFSGVDRGHSVDTYAVAGWVENGRYTTKTFNVKRHGLLPAFTMAVVHRARKIEDLIRAGESYTEKHGLARNS